jgi:hypothetical protein
MKKIILAFTFFAFIGGTSVATANVIAGNDIIVSVEGGEDDKKDKKKKKKEKKEAKAAAKAKTGCGAASSCCSKTKPS